MKNDTPSKIDQQIQERSAEVFTLRNDPACTEEQHALLEKASLPCDPDLAKTLNELFQRQPQGRKEFACMQADGLRRASRGLRTEQIFRAYGVLELVTPVRQGNQLLHALFSGPLKVSPWTAQEKETLAALCGISTGDLPASLDNAILFSPDLIQYLVRSREDYAQLLAHSLKLSETPHPEEAAPMPSSIGLELLQPGFADHLDLLFSSVQKELRSSGPLSEASCERIRLATQRGRHLASHIRQRSQGTLEPTGDVSVHQLLTQWKNEFSRQHPALRINLRLDAKADQVTANPQQLQHMLFTLMASVVDGLSEGAAVMGLSTRTVQHHGEPFLHVEIRDGGGLATFAGVGGETDAKLTEEQNQAALEFADWFTLASRMKAELNVLRDEGIVTRAELYLPLHPQAVEESTDPHHIWIVEDEDREFESLHHMLQTDNLHCTRFVSAADLREKFSLTTNPPDLVLLKYYLPDQRGAEVRSWIYEQDPALPVIMISGLQATHPGIATANSLPSTLYLQKPFDSQDLLDMVHMNLDDTLPG